MGFLVSKMTPIRKNGRSFYMSDTIARIIDMGTGEVIKDINEGDKVKVTRKESI